MKSVLAMVLAAGVAAAAHAETAPAKGDPAKAQAIVTQVCAGCHNADGNSAAPANPKLSGQPAEYITKQLRNFKAALADAGKEGVRKSDIMGPLVKDLSEQDMLNIGAYFAEKAPKPATAKIPYTDGEKLYRGGNAGTGVPACAACHGATGQGIPVQFPRVAGQHADYIYKQLMAFRNNDRKNDAGKMMRTIANKMSEKEMRDVANYISGMK